MMFKFSKILLLFLTVLLLASCSRELETKKYQVLSDKELRDKGNIPDQIFYDATLKKLAITYLRSDKTKIMAFYDLEGEKPIFYAETEIATDILPPGFAKDFQLAFALFDGKKWGVYLRTFVNQAPTPI